MNIRSLLIPVLVAAAFLAVAPVAKAQVRDYRPVYKHLTDMHAAPW
jgi:hypothetical protein